MMSIKCKIVSCRYLDFTLQPLIIHETDMTPWEIFPRKTGNDRLIPHFWWNFFAHPSPGIPTKHSTRDTASKGNI